MSDILSPLKRYESLQTNKSTNTRKKIKSYTEKNSSCGNNSYLSMNSYILNKKYNFINSFILVGCWNHIDCEKSALNTPIFRDIVINQINKEYHKLVIIAGDNWYSQQFNEGEYTYKYYPLHVLRSGYELLFKNKKKFYDIILGNHDEANDKIIDNSHNNIKNDCMLKIQKYVINNIANNISFINPPSLEDVKTIPINNLQINNIHLLTCIDKPEIKKMNEDVYTLYINTNLFDNFTYKTKNIENSNTITSNMMSSYVKNIEKLLLIYNPKLLFVVGHNPLTAYKKSKYHKLADIYKDPNNSYIMEMLIKILNNYKTIYLCADVHNFNIALLNSNLGTVIAGTGGGSPDLEKEEGNLNLLKSPNKKLMQITNHYVYNAYGYAKIRYDKKFNVYVTYRQLFNAYKDKKFENKLISKTIKNYNFVFKNTENGWKLEKIPNTISSKKINLNIPKLVDYKKKMCNIIKSYNKNNITSLISKNQLIKSNVYKHNYLKNDKDTPLLCFYASKKKKPKA
tara:strand:+ start:485 stop:2020 length:1536 start_codon:yes stop_codon:yes gene_type:complete